MRTSVRAIVIVEGLLLVEHHGGVTFPPGGRVEVGEDLESALTRELKEELPGLGIEPKSYLGRINNKWHEKGGVVESEDHFYLCEARGVDVRAKVVPGEFGRKYKWIKVTELERERLMPALLRELLQEERFNSEGKWDYRWEDGG